MHTAPFVIAMALLGTSCERDIWHEPRSSEELAHDAFVAAEKPACVRQRATIEAEIATLGDHPWAGEYSWRISGGCGNFVQQETIELAPHAGAVWWWRGIDLNQSHAADHGDIVSVDADFVVVHWTINTHDAHHDDSPEHVLLLDEKLARVKWGTKEFLIPACRMSAFSAAVSSGCAGMRLLAPRRGGWVARPWEPEFDVLPDGVPEVPAPWRSRFLQQPIAATAIAQSKPQLLGSFSVLPWTVDHRRIPWRFRARVDAGAAQGVLPDMRFYTRIVAPPEAKDVYDGRVIRVAESESEIEFWGSASIKDLAPSFPSSMAVSTRDPRAR